MVSWGESCSLALEELTRVGQYGVNYGSAFHQEHGIVAFGSYQLHQSSRNFDVYRKIQDHTSHTALIVVKVPRNPTKQALGVLLLRQSQIQNSLASGCDHISTVWRVWIMNSEKRPALEMRWFDGGNLLHYVRVFGDQHVMDLIRQVAGGLAFIHRSGVVHGAVHPCSIMVIDGEEPRAKIIHVGLYTAITELQQSLPGGIAPSNKWMYQAPEQHLDYETVEPFVWTKMMDVYGFSGTIYATIARSIPFARLANRTYGFVRGIKTIREQGHAVHFANAKPGRMSDALWELVLRMWVYECEMRPTMDLVEMELYAI